nr:MAG TPA: hypothetical protein [Bacteriophage sp.]
MLIVKHLVLLLRYKHNYKYNKNKYYTVNKS